jgi:monoamine oxidase
VPKVVVVGAGFSGLSCARELRRNGVEVIVLEARERIGGRGYAAMAGGAMRDLGGQWIGANQSRMFALAAEADVTLYPQHHEGRKLLWRDGRLRSYRGFLPALPAFALAELGVRISQIERLCAQVDPAEPWRHSRAHQWDRMSLADWLQRVRFSGARDALRVAAEMVFAAEPREISFLFFLQYLRGGGGLTPMVSINSGAQMWRVSGGAASLAETLHSELADCVELSQPVFRIEQSAAGGVVTSSATAKHRSDRVVLALPPALVDRIEFSPALPARRMALHQAMPMGAAIKCVIGYPEPFWRHEGLSGEALSTSKNVRAVFDGCGVDGAAPALTAFIVGDAAKELSGAPAEIRQRLVVEELALFFGPKARRPAFYIDKDWPADPLSAGCFAGVMGPGAVTHFSELLRQPIGSVHFAGTETARAWQGYFEGALEAGERAATEVLEALGAAPLRRRQASQSTESRE